MGVRKRTARRFSHAALMQPAAPKRSFPQIATAGISGFIGIMTANGDASIRKGGKRFNGAPRRSVEERLRNNGAVPFRLPKARIDP